MRRPSRGQTARRGADSPGRAPGLQAAVELRNRYFLWFRLAVRFVEAASLVALGRDFHGLGLAAAAACAVYDLGLAAALRRGGRWGPFWPRLALDAVDVAAWSVAIGTAPTVAVLVLSPVAVEAGMRFGLRALLVPLVIGLTTNIAMRAAGQPLSPVPVLWPLDSVVLGALAMWYLRQRMARRLRVADREIEAAAGRAELAGQNSVASGADTVVDLLTRTMPLFAASGAPVPASPLAAWKLALAEASADRATYLGVALTRWERLRNSMSPFLRADVVLRCVDGTGTVLLSPAQARALDTALDNLALRGTETVRMPFPAPAGREQSLLVGGRLVVLPADPSPTAPSLDLGPVGLVIAATAALTHSLPNSEAVPLPATIPLAVAAGAGAWWAHRWIDRRGDAGHAHVLVVALALGAADAIVSTLGMRNVETDGMLRLPFLLFLMWLGPLLALYWRDLSSRARWLMMLGISVPVTAGFALLPAAVSLTHVVVAAVWPVSTTLAGIGLRGILDRDTSDIGAGLQRRLEDAIDEAYQRGRDLVVELTAAAASEARRTYEAVRDRLPAAQAAELGRRLAEIDARLQALLNER